MPAFRVPLLAVPRMKMLHGVARPQISKPVAFFSCAPTRPQAEPLYPKLHFLVVAGISALSFGAGVLFSRREKDDTATTKPPIPRSGYGGPEERKAAKDALRSVFHDRPDLVSTIESDIDTHARWFIARKGG